MANLYALFFSAFCVGFLVGGVVVAFIEGKTGAGAIGLVLTLPNLLSFYVNFRICEGKGIINASPAPRGM